MKWCFATVIFKSELRHCTKRTYIPMPYSFVGCVVEFADKLSLAYRVLEQKQNEKNKLYSLHAPVVECIVMGKVHKRNEFGVKVKIAMTNRSNFVVVRMVLPDNPYDGHTLKRALEQTCRLSQKQIDEVFVDRDYRRHSGSLSRNYVSGQKRGITTRKLERSLKRRQAVKLVTSPLKSDRLLVRNRMKGYAR